MSDAALACYFRVEIYGVLRGGYFDKVSGITSEIETVKNWVTSEENDPIYQEQIPGRRMSGDITLTGTVTENQGFWQWHQDIAEGKDRRVNCSIASTWLQTNIGQNICSML